jgi:hypothetical protein
MWGVWLAVAVRVRQVEKRREGKTELFSSGARLVLYSSWRALMTGLEIFPSRFLPFTDPSIIRRGVGPDGPTNNCWQWQLL